MAIKDYKYVKINSVNFLYFNIDKVNGYFEEINENKYLTLNSMKIKKDLKSMKNCGVKSDVSLGQELNAQMIMMKGIWKLNLI